MKSRIEHLPEPEIMEIGTRVRFIVYLAEQIPITENLEILCEDY